MFFSVARRTMMSSFSSLTYAGSLYLQKKTRMSYGQRQTKDRQSARQIGNDGKGQRQRSGPTKPPNPSLPPSLARSFPPSIPPCCSLRT